MAEETQVEPALSPFAAMQAVAMRMIEAEEGTAAPAAEGEQQQASEGDGQAQGDQEQEQATAAAAAAAQALRKHKLVVKAEDGSDQEVEVDDEELKKGFMLEKDYRRKTAQIAREREKVQSEAGEALGKKLKEYDDKLALAEQAIWHTLAPEIQQVDWNKLAQENPAEWAQRYQHVQTVNARLAAVQAERQKIAKAHAEEAQKAYRRNAEESLEALKTEVPGWGDELYGKILKTGMEYGFRAEEVNAIVDHRALKVLHDAMQYRALKRANPLEGKKVVTAPRVVKPGATGETPSDPSADKWKEGITRLRKTGSRHDAVPVMMEYLKREGGAR